METITERTKKLIAHKTTAAKRFKELEEITKIPGGTWRTWWNKDTRPSGEMIEVIARAWPEYAFWLATGIDDFPHGHISPEPNQKWIRTAARDYFLAEIELKEWMKQYPEDESLDESAIRQGVELKIEAAQKYEIRVEQEKSLQRITSENNAKEMAKEVSKGGTAF
jgi:hypothetical protein